MGPNAGGCPVTQQLAKQSQRLVLDSFAAVSDYKATKAVVPC